jgi:hypothetical protein
MLFIEHAVRVPVPGLVQAAAGGGLAPMPHRHPQLCYRQQVMFLHMLRFKLLLVEVLPLCLITILNYAIVSRYIFMHLVWFNTLLVEDLPFCLITILNYSIVSRHIFMNLVWFNLLLVEVLPLCLIAILSYAIVSR